MKTSTERYMQSNLLLARLSVLSLQQITGRLCLALLVQRRGMGPTQPIRHPMVGGGQTDGEVQNEGPLC